MLICIDQSALICIDQTTLSNSHIVSVRMERPVPTLGNPRTWLVHVQVSTGVEYTDKFDDEREAVDLYDRVIHALVVEAGLS